MRTRLIVLGLLLASVAGLAQAKRHATDYAAYAGEPVREFRFTQLYNWQRVTDRQMVVWTKPSTAYLLNLRNNCDAMTGRVTVQLGGVDGVQGRLRETDDVIVGDLHCRVESIQPLDLVRMKADQARPKPTGA
jgi:Family of unknown function (DUF6491)